MCRMGDGVGGGWEGVGGFSLLNFKMVKMRIFRNEKDDQFHTAFKWLTFLKAAFSGKRCKLQRWVLMST